MGCTTCLNELFLSSILTTRFKATYQRSIFQCPFFQLCSTSLETRCTGFSGVLIRPRRNPKEDKTQCSAYVFPCSHRQPQCPRCALY